MTKSSFKWLFRMKCFSLSSSSLSKKTEEESIVDDDKATGRIPGGWKSMPYIIGNETFEKLATLGLLSNFMIYLLTQFHMKQVFANNVLNIWSGTTNFAPLLGAFFSDAYLGRFRTIAISSVASFLGMTALTLTALIPTLRPPSCAPGEPKCTGPTPDQLGFLFFALGLLTIGAAGIRPCSLPFGVDQFDPTTEKGRKGINSFFNWYYFTFTVAGMIAITLVVYVQDTVSWALGLGIPTLLMFCSIVLFFVGTRVYIHVPPQGSVFSGIGQVFVAAFKNRHRKLPIGDRDQRQLLYNPSAPKGSIVSKLPLTHDFSFLNKAAIPLAGEVNPDGTPVNKWTLCSIQQIEEVKCLLRIGPIWASGVICFIPVIQQSTFTVVQALKTDRHLGPSFQIPPGSLSLFTMLALTIWIVFYDRILVPIARRITKQESGITLLQRMGVGLVISILSMVVAGLVEEKRRDSAVSAGKANGVAPMSVLWLAPQLALLGVAEAFNGIGQIEFYYKQFPEHMRSIAGSLFFCGVAGANYLSSLVVSMVDKNTKKHGHRSWLDDNINVGRVDYFYYILAALGAVNFFYFLVCAHRYRYKGIADSEEGDVVVVVELTSSKNGGN